MILEDLLTFTATSANFGISLLDVLQLRGLMCARCLYKRVSHLWGESTRQDLRHFNNRVMLNDSGRSLGWVDINKLGRLGSGQQSWPFVTWWWAELGDVSNLVVDFLI
jgi:hypothetical protein